MTIPREVYGDGTRLVYRAMSELRPQLGTAEEFVGRVNRLQRPEGYRLVAVFNPGEEEAMAVAGFRVGHFLAWGHALYCDDLSTCRTARGQGYGGALIDWMIAEGRRLHCDQFHLDSGVGLERAAAHRLYLNKRMVISSHHFAMALR